MNGTNQNYPIPSGDAQGKQVIPAPPIRPQVPGAAPARDIPVPPVEPLKPSPAPDAGERAELFVETGPEDRDKIAELHDFVMPLVVEARGRLTAQSRKEDIEAWLDAKMKTPGLKIPKSMVPMTPGELRGTLAEEMETQLQNQDFFNLIKSQILIGFDEISDNAVYGENDELVASYEGFALAIEGIILQNENVLTDVQKYDLSLLKDDIDKITTEISLKGQDDYDVILLKGQFRKKLGVKPM